MKKTNSARLILLAGALAITLGACDAVSGRQTAGQYVDDTTTTSKVMAGIVDEPSLTLSEIHVETLNQVIQLSGFVSSEADKMKAGQIAKGVSAMAVKNNLIVQ
jgi:hyperosmotically inducible protein